jgi:hypothetical protein
MHLYLRMNVRKIKVFRRKRVNVKVCIDLKIVRWFVSKVIGVSGIALKINKSKSLIKRKRVKIMFLGWGKNRSCRMARKIWIIVRGFWTFWTCRFFCFCIFWDWAIVTYWPKLIFSAGTATWRAHPFPPKFYRSLYLAPTTSLGTWLSYLIVKFAKIWPFWVRNCPWSGPHACTRQAHCRTCLKSHRRPPIPTSRSSCAPHERTLTIMTIIGLGIIFIDWAEVRFMGWSSAIITLWRSSLTGC